MVLEGIILEGSFWQDPKKLLVAVVGSDIAIVFCIYYLRICPALECYDRKGFDPLRMEPTSRPNIPRIASHGIRRSVFLNYIKLIDLRI